MHDIPQIKARLSCLDYAQRIGLPTRKDGDRCKSPIRTGADNASAFVVHTDYWYDFVEGKGGDVIDLSALANHNGDRGLAIIELARLTGALSDDDYDDWRQRTQRRVSLIQGWYEDLRPQDREYLHSRRITDETIDRLRIGYTGQGTTVTVGGEQKHSFGACRIAIPAYKNGYVFSWVARATRPEPQPKYLKPPIDSSTEYEPWGLHTLNRNADSIYIAEGAFDYLAIEQSGYPVLASMGGYFGKETLKNVLAVAKDYKQVVLTFDNDDAGRRFTRDFGNILFQHKIKFAVAEIPNKYKDIADFYADGNEIANLKMQDGILFLAKSINDNKEEFKTFAYRAARILEKSELAELFSIIEREERFGKAWLKEIQQSCYRAPPEPIIAAEIIAKHRLLFIAGVGFYEYTSSGKWDLLKDEVIHGYIIDALGVYASGGKLEPISKLLRSELLSEQELNRAPVVNFINGTLELDTGNFREHSPDDFCSIQLPYPYLPEVKAARWEQFIEEVTAHDAMRAENLQFIAGYALFSDCRHEKIFVLTGNGGNGKSIYTKMLIHLFGDENVSNVTPAGLTEAFKLIHLRSSLLNIAGEIRSDLAEAEEMLKQISSGETVQACYKGKDHINFKPRSKLIFCCNGQLRAADTSDGIVRRLEIINFECKFVDEPDPADPYQLPKDTTLEPQLITELPGICNWAYQGYTDLLFYGQFTQTDDSAELISNFRRASNPVECFIDDLTDNPPAEISRADIYNRYRDWCDENGHKSLSATRFHPEFREHAKKHYNVYEKSTRAGGTPIKERGYILRG